MSQVGSEVYASKLADLEEAHPVHAAQYDSQCGQKNDLQGAKAMDEIDRRDRLGNVRTVKLYRDYYRGLPENGTGYVGAIRAGVPVKMMSGKLVMPVAATGEGRSVEDAVMATMADFNDHWLRK